jgi:hypothetical protein
VQNPELILIPMILEKAFYNVGTKGISIIKSYYGTGGDLNDEIHEVPHDRRMWCMASARRSLNGHSNLLKTRLIELVNYVKVWLR